MSTIGTKAEDRAEWLAQRRKSLGASDAAAALGLSPYRSPLELWLVKTGRMTEGPETMAMRMGTLLEPVLAKLYTEETGLGLVGDGFQRQVASPFHAFLTATLDAVNVEDNPVEFKTVGPYSRAELGEPGTEEIPAHWMIQVHQQMYCWGARQAEVAVLVGGQEFRIYRVKRNEDLIKAMIPKLADFWSHVETDEPPPALPPHDPRVLRALYPDCAGEVALGQAELACAAAYEGLGATIAQLQEERDEAKAGLLLALGNAQGGLLPDGRRVKRAVVRVRAHQVKESEFVRLSIQKARD
jgi:putative phage-type endonuclease